MGRKKKNKDRTHSIIIISFNLSVEHRLENLEFVNFLEKQISEDVQIMGFAEPNINWHLEIAYRDVERVFKYV